VRTREQINQDKTSYNFFQPIDIVRKVSELNLELSLDIRDLMKEINKQLSDISDEVCKSSQYIRR
jgi:hypothetical protein